MAHWKELFGNRIIGKSGDLEVESHLNGKVVLIYFSAHWCPPCRGFTPQLAKFYNTFQKVTQTPFEIVFVSSDKDQASFSEYYNEMPWTALPFEERDRKASLSKKYGVQGIPTLIVLDTDGNIINKNGRGAVAEDPEGAKFPWKPRSVLEILSGKLQTHNGEIDASSLEGKYFGIYFSAHWCPPCRGFTPKLVETYNKLKQAGKEFEIVFVSSDRKQEEFKEYFDSMPWVSTGFKDSRQSELSDVCNVEGIPQLSLIGPEGNVVSHNGRSFVTEDPNGLDFPWYPKPLQGIAFASDVINSEPCLIAIFPQDSETNKQKLDAFREIANEHTASHVRGEVDKINFFYSMDLNGMAGRLCQFFSVSTANPVVIYTNIPESYTTCDPNPDEVRALLDGIQKKTAKLSPLPE